MLGTLIGFFVGLGVGGLIIDALNVDIINPMDSADGRPGADSGDDV